MLFIESELKGKLGRTIEVAKWSTGAWRKEGISKHTTICR
jgi:hypothetical protein